MRDYQYHSLQTEQGEIRLLSLSPRNQGQLHISIWHARLGGDGKAPKFEALSYTWGSSLATHIIQVRPQFQTRKHRRGVEKQAIRITDNLATALPHLQLDTEYRTLWIDALCINQGDRSERELQVGRMAEIYTFAARVVVWLGRPANDSQLALALMKFIASRVEVTYGPPEDIQNLPRSDIENDFVSIQFERYLHYKKIKYTSKEAQAINALFHRTWFERLWVWQEIVLGHERALMLCGNDAITWKDFSSATMLIAGFLTPDRSNPDLRQWVRRQELIFSMCKQAASSVTSVYHLLRDAGIKSTNPLDRLYGCLSIVSGRDAADIAPIAINYSLSPQSLFGQLALSRLRHRQTLDFLMYCTPDDLEWSPSWVPNFATGLHSAQILPKATPYADAGAVVNCDCIFGHRIQVEGVVVARVTESRPFGLEDINTFNDRRYLKIFEASKTFIATFDGVNLTEKSTGGLTKAQAFALLVGANEASERQYHMDPPEMDLDYGTLARMGEALRLLATEDACFEADSEYLFAHEWALEYIIDNCAYRHLVITDNDHLGFTGHQARVGDVISVILGCPIPLLLRPSDNHSYRVVGMCLTTNIDQGEILLGPLPEGTYAVERATAGVVFINRTSGLDTWLDPRIAWDELRINSAEFAPGGKWIFDDDHEQYYRRPDADYFRRHGAALSTFLLE